MENNIYISGFTNNIIVIDTITLNGIGGTAGFIAKLSQCNTPSVGVDIQNTCDPLVWIDGNTYLTNNNTATFNIIGGSSWGCDSLVTLNLTITPIDTSTTIAGSGGRTSPEVGDQLLQCMPKLLPFRIALMTFAGQHISWTILDRSTIILSL